MPEVLIIILNWNNYTDTKDCISSLQRLTHKNYNILLIDNGSTDDSGKRIQNEYPNIDSILLKENLGFGAGNNVGIREALKHDFDYVWFLNNDTLIPHDSSPLSNSVDLMESNQEIGVITPKIMHYPEIDQVWFKHGFVDRRSGYAAHKKSHKWYLDFRLARHKNKVSADSRVIQDDYIPFCSALVRTEVLNEVGLYPEEYFLYYGDVDFCFQIKEHGYKIVTDTKSEIHHRVSSSSETTRSPTHLYYLARNRQLLMKNHPEKISNLFYLFFLWWMFLNAADRLTKRDFSGLRALLEGTVDGSQGKSGRGRYP